MNFLSALHTLDQLVFKTYASMDADARTARLQIYTDFVRLSLRGIASYPPNHHEPLRFLVQVLEHAVSYFYRAS